MGATTAYLIPSLLAIAQFIAPAHADCNTFTPISSSPDSTTATSTNTTQAIRISQILSCTDPTPASQLCDPTSQCYLTPVPNLLFNINATLNITGQSDASTAKILAQAKQSIPSLAGSDDYNFNLTQTYSLQSLSAVCLAANQTEYFAFVPRMVCVTGELGGCQGEGASDGTVVTACGISTQGQRDGAGLPIPDGVVSTEDTDSDVEPAPANVTSIITNVPANTSNPSNSSGSSDSSSTSKNSGVLLSPAMNGVWVGGLVAAAAAMLCGIL